MIKAGQVEKGTALLIKGQPFICVEREFVNPGKGSAFVRLRLKSPQTGQVLRETFKSQDNVEDITVADRDCQYLYNDGTNFHFMLTDTFEQIEIPMATFEGYEFIMKDGETYRVTFWENQPLDIVVPTKVVFEVAEGRLLCRHCYRCHEERHHRDRPSSSCPHFHQARGENFGQH